MSTEAIPKILYHYSSIDTLTKVLAGKQLWATHIRYLNDQSERLYFWEEIKKNAGRILKENPDLDHSILMTFLDGNASKRLESLPFATSFSSDGDSLPQWRSYCPQGGGVAIGFRASSLQLARVERPNNSFSTNTVRLAKVEYLEPDSDHFLEFAVSALLDARTTRSRLAPPGSNTVTFPLEALFFGDLESRSALVKMASFSEEKEYRLLTKLYIIDRQVQFRPSRTSLIPYVRLDLPPFEQSDEHDYIAEIVVGPSASQMLTIDSLRYMLELFNIEAEVRKSDIPYRDWL